MTLHREEWHVGIELRGRVWRGQGECHENRPACPLNVERAADLLDAAPHRLDALQAASLSQQGFVDNVTPITLNDTAHSFLVEADAGRTAPTATATCCA